jgi:hypothetical protein
MTRARHLVLSVVFLCLPSCSPPVQRGGLGVFNPQGFQGRVALVGQYVPSGAAHDPAVVKKPSP